MISWHTDLNAPPPGCTQLEWEWLSYRDSLTERLQRLSGHTTHLQVLKSAWGQAENEEARLLLTEKAVTTTSAMWIREIIHVHQQKVWIWGRTLIPAVTLQKTSLNARTSEAIGHILFRDPDLQRSNIALSLVDESHPYFSNIQPYLQKAESLPWARRSIFSYQHHPLLIIEVFLPNFFNYHSSLS